MECGLIWRAGVPEVDERQRSRVEKQEGGGGRRPLSFVGLGWLLEMGLLNIVPKMFVETVLGLCLSEKRQREMTEEYPLEREPRPARGRWPSKRRLGHYAANIRQGDGVCSYLVEIGANQKERQAGCHERMLFVFHFPV